MLTACNGQSTKQSKTDHETALNTTSRPQPKLVKTQGSNESDNVCCGLQDKNGNLWFGTTGEGVYRYNGKTFTQFTVKDGLSSNGVYAILEDKSGSIWFGTVNGICQYDGKNITPISIPIAIRPEINNNNYYSEQSTKNTVWSMLQDKNGLIWFGTGDGVYYFDGLQFYRFLADDYVTNKEGLHLKLIDCMVEDKNGHIWFASGCPPGNEGICRYDGQSVRSYKPNGDGWIRTIKVDKKRNLWFGGRLHGNFTYDGKNFRNFTQKVGIGNAILVDKKGNIWFNGEEKTGTVQSEAGIWCYNGKIFNNYQTKDGMSSYFVWFMLEDKMGNIWLGTRNTGLYKFDGSRFFNYAE
jgi:ligand-binding sensor domain-containing protein